MAHKFLLNSVSLKANTGENLTDFAREKNDKLHLSKLKSLAF